MQNRFWTTLGGAMVLAIACAGDAHAFDRQVIVTGSKGDRVAVLRRSPSGNVVIQDQRNVEAIRRIPSGVLTYRNGDLSSVTAVRGGSVGSDVAVEISGRLGSLSARIDVIDNFAVLERRSLADVRNPSGLFGGVQDSGDGAGF